MILNKYTKVFFIFLFIFLNCSSLLYAEDSGIGVNLEVGGCNNNNVCDKGEEDMFSCPSDCTPASANGASGSSPVMDNIFNNLTIDASYNSVVIKWKSSIPTMSNLKWGTSEDYKDGVLRNINFLVDHEVTLTNLKDGTIYYFNISAESLVGKTKQLEGQSFQTLFLPDTVAPLNPTNVKAISSQAGITVSWGNPPDFDFDYIRVMRSSERYIGDPMEGTLVYEGRGAYFTDSGVDENIKYYYSLYSRDKSGNYSSGSLLSIVHNPKGKDDWGNVLPPLDIVSPIEGVKYIVTQGSSTYDFINGSTLSLGGDEIINIKTNYTSQTKDDDLWLEIRGQDRKLISQYFFFRSKDKEGFSNVYIAPFAESGKYAVSVNHYSNNQSQTIQQGTFKITKVTSPVKYSGYIEYIIWLLIFIILLIITWFYTRGIKKIQKVEKRKIENN